MLIKIGAKSLQIVLNKEDAEELRDFVLHRYIPGQHNSKKQNKAWDGETAEKNFAIATQHSICADYQHRKRGSHRAFGQSAHAQQSVED
jgi:hypothetical protein